MSYLNKSDFINMKYLIVSTGLVNNGDIMDEKDENDLSRKLESHLSKMHGVNDPANIIKELFNESFYYLKHYSYLHKNGVCPVSYDGNDWGINFTDESILLIRLYQNLSQMDFYDILRTFMGVQKEEFLNFEMDFNKLNANEYLPKVYNWLRQKGNPFAEKLQILIQDRFGDIETKQESMPLNQSISKTQGICLIINNENCLGYPKRHGTMADEKNLKKTFSELNFNILIYRDVPKEDLIRILESTKSEINNEDRLFVAFFLSHGKKGILITSDGKEIKFKDIWDPFRGSLCKILLMKPKLFFFVCCQGKDINQSISSDEIQVDSATLEVDAIFGNSKHPDIADFFFGYATYKTLLSYRHSKNGTFYIQNLCETIRKYTTKSISEIHERVNGLFQKAEIPGKNCFQTPYYKSLLGEPCYLVNNNNR